MEAIVASSAAAVDLKRGRSPLVFTVSVEQLILYASLYWALSANQSFLAAVLAGRSWTDPSAGLLGASMAVLLVALHALLLAVVATRLTVKPLVGILLVVSALATYYMGSYGVYLDPTMMRNVLRTDLPEVRELATTSLLLHVLLYAGLPLLLLWHVRIRPRRWRRALLVRSAFMGGLIAALAIAVLCAFQPLASLMRNHREVRYLITPANVLWSTARIAVSSGSHTARPHQPIGVDAVAGTAWTQRRRPMVLVLVVGETARAANWGLNGYLRNTTPQLARLPVLNFANVKACGTSTEVSLPCMFAPVGRRDYDEARIRSQQSLLHVLARAGVAVHWRDNQSGCKGVCDGLAGDQVSAANAPGLCTGDRCLDEALIADLDRRLQSASSTEMWVFHMIGNHGPSYFRRYPAAFARFQPDCREDELSRCSVAEIVNAYDNALLYTDHVLASAIRRLQSHSDTVDSTLIYVSDHGESLGEQGLFLHGMPYAIAPQVQTQVPMIAFASAGFERSAGLAPGCLQRELQRRAAQPLAHDHLFHTVLGLLDVRTSLHEPSLDLVAPCRNATASAS